MRTSGSCGPQRPRCPRSAHHASSAFRAVLLRSQHHTLRPRPTAPPAVAGGRKSTKAAALSPPPVRSSPAAVVDGDVVEVPRQVHLQAAVGYVPAGTTQLTRTEAAVLKHVQVRDHTRAGGRLARQSGGSSCIRGSPRWRHGFSSPPPPDACCVQGIATYNHAPARPRPSRPQRPHRPR